MFMVYPVSSSAQNRRFQQDDRSFYSGQEGCLTFYTTTLVPKSGKYLIANNEHLQFSGVPFACACVGILGA